jgi:monoterpene epsilon-lactone hydrolase
VASDSLSTVLELVRSAPLLDGTDIHGMRATMVALTAVQPLADDIAYEPTSLGGVAAEWTSVRGTTADRTVLYFHGGAYCLGSIATHRALVGNIAREGAARVASIEYRLAPEDPFPAAVDDGVAAYRALVAAGTPPTRVALAGDSAGGGLTAATLLALRDAGDPLPACAVCISPWLDLSCSGDSMRTRAHQDPMIVPARLRALGEAYLAGASSREPLASPVFGDFRGLPPLLLHVGTAETLLDDSTRLAERARAAGVDVSLEVWDDMIHVWHAFSPLLPEADRALARIGEFLRTRLP